MRTVDDLDDQSPKFERTAIAGPASDRVLVIDS